ncbi:MAG: hypothetical protein WBM41_15100 [Arenicellales bacterium]
MKFLTALTSGLNKVASKEAGPVVSGKTEVDTGRPKTAKALRLFGVFGITMSSAMLLWFLIGLLGLVPSMIDVFGVPGLRVPAGIAISGLLAASIGFSDY